MTVQHINIIEVINREFHEGVIASWSGVKSDGTASDAPRVWAMQDVDQKNAEAATGSKPAWFDQLPKKPVHGEVRLTLFFDWHVEPVKVPES